MSSCLVIIILNIKHFYLYTQMFSTHPKPFSYNSPIKDYSKEKNSLLTSVGSKETIKFINQPKIQNEDTSQQKPNYSKLLKQKDLKIINLTQKVKLIQASLSKLKNSHQGLQNEAQFFKSKVQEQFYRNVCLESQLDIINNTIKNLIIKIVNLFKNDDKSMKSFATYLQSLKKEGSEQDSLQISKKLLHGLEFQIQQLTNSFILIKRDSETEKSLVKSVDLKFHSFKKIDQKQKEQLKDHINNLIDYYETKEIDQEEYNQQIANLRNQRQFIKSLLATTEKERNQFVNKVYQIGRKQYKIDFETMNKLELVKLCVGLFARIKELENDVSKLSSQLKTSQSNEKKNYQNMLKHVKLIEQKTDKKSKLKRMVSFN